jgi:mono/diheme cytochrome c family protein
MTKMPRLRVLAGCAAVAVSLSFAALPAAAEDLSGYTGAGLFQRFCAACHGRGGGGDGPVSGSLKVAVPDLTHIQKRSGGTFPTERVIRTIDGREATRVHGPRDMPVWGQEFRAAGAAGATAQPDALIQRLVEYLRSIQAP